MPQIEGSKIATCFEMYARRFCTQDYFSPVFAVVAHQSSQWADIGSQRRQILSKIPSTAGRVWTDSERCSLSQAFPRPPQAVNSRDVTQCILSPFHYKAYRPVTPRGNFKIKQNEKSGDDEHGEFSASNCSSARDNRDGGGTVVAAHDTKTWPYDRVYILNTKSRMMSTMVEAAMTRMHIILWFFFWYVSAFCSCCRPCWTRVCTVSRL